MEEDSVETEKIKVKQIRVYNVSGSIIREIEDFEEIDMSLPANFQNLKQLLYEKFPVISLNNQKLIRYKEEPLVNLRECHHTHDPIFRNNLVEKLMKDDENRLICCCKGRLRHKYNNHADALHKFEQRNIILTDADLDDFDKVKDVIIIYLVDSSLKLKDDEKKCSMVINTTEESIKPTNFKSSHSIESILNFDKSVTKNVNDTVSKAVSKGGDGVQAVETLVADLRKSNDKSISKNFYWITFSVDGMQLKGQIIYPGFIAAFYAPFDTTGSSGFHWSNSSCTVLSGEVSRINNRLVTPFKETYTVKQPFRHGEFDGYIYHLNAGTSVACYGRGVVPVSGIWSTFGVIADGNSISILMQGYVYAEAHYRWNADNCHPQFCFRYFLLTM